MKTDSLSSGKTFACAAPVLFLAALLPEYLAPVLTFVFAVIVLNNCRRCGKAPKPGAVGNALLVFLAWCLISSFWSSSALTSAASLGVWLLMLGGYFVMTETVTNEERLGAVIKSGAALAGVEGAIGIGQMFIYHFGNRFVPGMSKMFNPFWRCLDLLIEKAVVLLPDSLKSKMASTTFHTFETRACGTFSNPIFFSSVGVMLLPFAAYVFLCGKDKKQRLLGFLCFMLDAGGIACSYSRGPYIAAAAVFVILCFYGVKKLARLAAVGALALGGLLVFSRGTLKRLLTLKSTGDVSINTRKAIWKAAFEMLKKKPVFGYGNGFDNIRSVLHNTYGIKQPHAHNIILEIWLENGIFGVIAFAAIFVVFLVLIIRLAKLGTKQREYAVTLFASAAGFMLCGMTDCLFYGLKPLQYLLMLLGLSQAVYTLFLCKKPEEEKETETAVE